MLLANFRAQASSHSYRQEGFHSLTTGDDVRNDLGNLQVGSVEQVVVRELRNEVDGIVEVCQDQFL
jgi:hypothetical protein